MQQNFPKLIIVYNICGIGNNDNTFHYINAINTILAQDFKDYKLIISSCCNTENCIETLKSTFGNHVAFNITNEVLPVPVTFNLSVLNAIKMWGPAEGYLYIDSGVSFTDNGQLGQLYKLFKSGPYAMVAAQTDTDSGYDIWFGVNSYEDRENKLFNNGNFIIPIGKSVNLHCQIFSHILVETYRRPYYDITAGHCSESSFSHICSAIKHNFILSKDILVKHIARMDGQSAGFNPTLWAMRGNKNWEHPFICKSVVERMRGGQEFGLGYEELFDIVPHHKAKFDSNHYSLDDRLAPYIRDNLYLTKDEFDYDNIEHEFIY